MDIREKLLKYRERTNTLIPSEIVNSRTFQDQADVTIVGVLQKVVTHKTEKRDKIAIGTLTNFESDIQIMLFPNAFKMFKGLLKEQSILFVVGKLFVDSGEDKYRIAVSNIEAF